MRRPSGRSLSTPNLAALLYSCLLKQWKRPRTIYRELKARGATEAAAKRVAGNSRCWWRNSDGLLKTVLTVAYFDRMGLPRLSCPQALEPPGADPHARWCGRGGCDTRGSPYADCGAKVGYSGFLIGAVFKALCALVRDGLRHEPLTRQTWLRARLKPAAAHRAHMVGHQFLGFFAHQLHERHGNRRQLPAHRVDQIPASLDREAFDIQRGELRLIGI